MSSKIYTRTGDQGTTGLFGGARVHKDDPRVEAYGTVDELCSIIGAARAAAPTSAIDDLLARLQEDLFVLGAELSTVVGKASKLPVTPLGPADVGRLERAIDDAESTLPALKTFILPGGSPAAAALHHARTVCRRAERRVIAMGHAGPPHAQAVVYLNRLSDLLFVLARRQNADAGVADVPWAPRGV